VAEPSASRLDAAYSSSIAGLTDALYTTRLKTMDATLTSLSGRQAVKVRVQQGILHALFGKLKEAETAFRTAITDDPTLISPYVNLANVRLLLNDSDGALAAVTQGLARNVDSALLNLLAARIYSNKGDAANTALYFAKVQKSAPEMAAQFAYLIPAAGGSGAQRAADASRAPVVIWGPDQ
jgi:tetratricopeptide (TPR) repeat protein